MNKQLKGLQASGGIAMAKAKVFIKAKLDIQARTILEKDIENEIVRLEEAFKSYDQKLKSRELLNEAEKAVNEAHIELLNDPYFFDSAKEKISNDKLDASRALKETADQMVIVMESLDDPYLRERAADYKDIGQNLLYILEGIEAGDLSDLSEDVIIVAEELTPSDTSTMDKVHTLGLISEIGGKTSHVSIIAQTLGLPALVGAKEACTHIKDGDFLILDADNESIYINPSKDVIEKFEKKIKEEKIEKERLEKIKHMDPVTKDGRAVELVNNIGNLDDLKLGIESGGKGVGLFRTEFLYMDNTAFPDEEEQFEVYKEAAQSLGDRPLIIRTLDIGGDKGLSYYEFPQEENPFLGWRALRVCFDLPEIFRTQVRAILRAGYYGNVKILLPMIISVDELVQVKDLVKDLEKELEEEGKKFKKGLDIGVMIETPASIMMADQLAKHADYFSIGTNDLTQYILAVDRGNDKIAKLYNSYNPAVLRAIKRAIEASHKEGKWCGMCGGFAGDTNATYMLLGMGLDEFSVPASKVAKVKDIIINSDYNEAKEFAALILSKSTVKEVEELIEENQNR